MNALRCCAAAGLVFAGATSSEAQVLPGNLVESTQAVLINHTYHKLSSNFTEGAGAAIGDFDNDGWDDIFLPDNSTFPNHLYRNLGNGTFAEEAAARGVDHPGQGASGGIFADYDRDGDVDLFVFGHAGNGAVQLTDLVRLFRNTGASGGYTFVDVTAQAGFVLDPTTFKGTTDGWQSGACAGDYNRDGHINVFFGYWQGTTNNDLWRLFKAAPNPIPGSAGDPNYTPIVYLDATKEAGLDFETSPGEPWQPMFVDLNRDGYLDLHCAMDFGLDYQFTNLQDGTFADVAGLIGMYNDVADVRNEMGVNFGDIDNDGDLDMHTTNLGYVDRMLRNDSVGPALQFVDVAPVTGLYDSPWGWGTIFFDFENDGDLDHATVSGFKFPTATPYFNRFHINKFPQVLGDGVTPLFMDATDGVPDFSKVLTQYGDACRGLVPIDYDNDGDQDILVTRQFADTAIYENTLDIDNDWLDVRLKDRNGSREMTGARVWLRANGVTQLRVVYSGSSFMCHESSRQHFGLGPEGTNVDWIVVGWPLGGLQVFHPAEFQSNTTNSLIRDVVDDTGDLDGDGDIDSVDERMLQKLIASVDQFNQLYPDSPGLITGDIDGNGLYNRVDHRLWQSMPKH